MMTDEQKKLVEDNIRLVTWYIGKKGLDFEEYFGMLSEELCLVAIHFDPGAGHAFSSYAARCFDNRVNEERRNRSTYKRMLNHEAVSLDKELDTGEEDSGLTLKDLIPGKHDVENEAITNIMLGNLLDGLSPYWKEVVLMRAEGMRLQDIADRFGVTRTRISAILREVKRRL